MGERFRKAKPILLMIGLAVTLWQLPGLLEKLDRSGLLTGDRPDVEALQETLGGETRIPIFDEQGHSEDLVLLTPDDQAMRSAARRERFEESDMNRLRDPKSNSIVRVKRVEDER